MAIQMQADGVFNSLFKSTTKKTPELCITRNAPITSSSPSQRVSYAESVSMSWRLLDRMVFTLRPRQNGRHFADDTYKRIFLNENARISIWISL